MTKNAKEYHDNTCYSRNKLGGHQLDWHNQPVLFKEYKGLKSISLPEPPTLPGISLKLIQGSKSDSSSPDVFNINTISTILRLTYCITAQANYSGGVFYYRSAASAGALYPVEIYVAIRNIDGIDDGLYHFNIMNHSLYLIREGNYSFHAGNITFPQPDKAPLISIMLSSIFFRSSWKYRERAYRYHLLDTGHVLGNLILALNSLSIFFDLNYDFDDNRLDELIGVDEFHEAGLVLVNIPGNETMPSKAYSPVDTLPQEITNAGITSQNDIDYPVIREIHEAGRIPSNRELSEIPPPLSPFQTDKWELVKNTDKLQTDIPYPECLFLRRSKRNFIDKKIDRTSLMVILDMISDSTELNHEVMYNYELLNIVFFAEKVDGINPGLYTLDRKQKRFGIIREGIFGEKIAHTCLNQEWLKNAGLHFLFVCDLDTLDKKYGPRGYRYAMMNAGKLGQLLYITATSLGLGCCGIGAFYDDEAINLLDLGSKTRLLYLVAVGKIKSEKGLKIF